MKDVFLGMTSKNTEGIHLSWDKRLTHIGLWILISSVATEVNMCTYWDNSDPSPFKDAPFILHIFMPFTCFYAITKALPLTDHAAPVYRVKFWEVRQIIHAWDWHTSDVFLAEWVYCLDKSM